MGKIKKVTKKITPAKEEDKKIQEYKEKLLDLMAEMNLEGVVVRPVMRRQEKIINGVINIIAEATLSVELATDKEKEVMNKKGK